MIVSRADQSIDGEQAVRARAILDDHRFAPAGGKVLAYHARSGIGSASRTERQKETEWSARRDLLADKVRTLCGG